jgi:hypothetical protein
LKLSIVHVVLKACLDLLWARLVQDLVLDMDEVECIAANLIYRKYVKAYLSHDKKTAVLAKHNPFPILASVLLTA